MVPVKVRRAVSVPYTVMVTVPEQVMTSSRLEYFDPYAASLAEGNSRFAPIADATANAEPSSASARTAARHRMSRTLKLPRLKSLVSNLWKAHRTRLCPPGKLDPAIATLAVPSSTLDLPASSRNLTAARVAQSLPRCNLWLRSAMREYFAEGLAGGS